MYKDILSTACNSSKVLWDIRQTSPTFHCVATSNIIHFQYTEKMKRSIILCSPCPPFWVFCFSFFTHILLKPLSNSRPTGIWKGLSIGGFVSSVWNVLLPGGLNKCTWQGPATGVQEHGVFTPSSAVVAESAIIGRLMERHLTPSAFLKDGRKAETPPEKEIVLNHNCHKMCTLTTILTNDINISTIHHHLHQTARSQTGRMTNNWRLWMWLNP